MVDRFGSSRCGRRLEGFRSVAPVGGLGQRHLCLFGVLRFEACSNSSWRSVGESWHNLIVSLAVRLGGPRRSYVLRFPRPRIAT